MSKIWESVRSIEAENECLRARVETLISDRGKLVDELGDDKAHEVLTRFVPTAEGGNVHG